MSELGNPYISNPLKEFNRIYKKTNEIYHDIALRLGLSDSAFDILYSISELGDGCLQKDICNATCIPKQTIHSSIRQMEKSGYLTLSSGKGRSMHITLTDLGKNLLERTIYPVMQMEGEAFHCMTDEECQQMLALFGKYIQALGDAAKNLSIQSEEP
ncbi:MAG: MarR family transcriptional regulator [Agathobacter sp.]|jgi:DNA-binding MarR family transcriptional regulator|nr:MarR family transcriptional regulator [Agathobacter sp.]